MNGDFNVARLEWHYLCYIYKGKIMSKWHGDSQLKQPSWINKYAHLVGMQFFIHSTSIKVIHFRYQFQMKTLSRVCNVYFRYLTCIGEFFFVVSVVVLAGRTKFMSAIQLIAFNWSLCTCVCVWFHHMKIILKHSVSTQFMTYDFYTQIVTIPLIIFVHLIVNWMI